MSQQRYYYLSTGSKQGFYTLRVYWRERVGDLVHDHDEYIANLSTDRGLALRKAREYVARRGGKLDPEVAFDLKEIKRRVACEANPYRLDFSLHTGKTVDELADTHPDFLIWLKHEFSPDNPSKGRFVQRINELLVIGHATLCTAEWEYTARQKAQVADRTAKDEALLAKFERAQHVGVVGEKITLVVRVTAIFRNEGQWGPTCTVLLRDAEGNYLRTSGTGKALWKLAQGEPYRISATVKAHGRFDMKLDKNNPGDTIPVRQTTLERLKLLESLTSSVGNN